MSVPDQPMEADRLTTPATGGSVLHPPRVDIVTTAAVAVVVCTSSSILHEALGHGLDQTPDPPVTLARNRRWIVFGVASAAVLIGVLGRGLKFHS